MPTVEPVDLLHRPSSTGSRKTFSLFGGFCDPKKAADATQDSDDEGDDDFTTFTTFTATTASSNATLISSKESQTNKIGNKNKTKVACTEKEDSTKEIVTLQNNRHGKLQEPAK